MAEIQINRWVHELVNNKSKFVFCRGGAGSGKSFGIAQKILIRITSEHKHRILCVRKVAKTLRRSIYAEFLDMIIELGIYHEFAINKTEMMFTHLKTGNEILLGGMDDPEKIKSIKGCTSVWMEEATEFDEADFDQLGLRVRGETVNYKQFIISFNPIDENHWLKKKIETLEGCQEVVTTYLDNHFLDDEYKNHLQNEISKNQYLYNVYVLGHWGQMQTGGEFYHSFKAENHLKKLEYNPDLPLHLSFDFNVLPYCTLLIFQLQGKSVNLIDEIVAKPPINRTSQLCKLFVAKYNAHYGGVFVYGDPAGKHKDTRSEMGWNDFDIIYNELTKFNPVKRVSAAAPPVLVRGNFINQILEHNYEDITLKFNISCVNTTNDLMYCKMDSDGTKLKQKVKNEFGATYEKYGHTSDCLDYFICEAFKNEFQQFKTGKKDLTYRAKTNPIEKLRY